MHKITIKYSFTILSILILASCASKSYVALLKNTDGSVGEVVVLSPEGETIIASENHAAGIDGSSKQTFEVSKEQLEEDFGRALKAQPPLPIHFLLYFVSGGIELTQESQALIPEITATS